jgi:hypothetical protein
VKQAFAGSGKAGADTQISEAKCLTGDSEELGPDSHEQSRMKAIFRLVSFALPSLVTIMALLLGWRQHFDGRSIPGVAAAIAGSIYLAIFFHRRSRGLSARIFNAATGPDEDQSSQDQTDIGVLMGTAVYIGIIVYALIRYW